jgi:hypothetical protein
MLTIENQIPLPPIRARFTYPFADMHVGDSFLLTDSTRVRRARSAAWMFSQRHPGVRFSCRRVADGWRLWRTA